MRVVIIASIEAKPMQMQGTQEYVQGHSSAIAASKQHVQEVQQVATQCVVDLVAVQVELGGLCMKISAPTK